MRLCRAPERHPRRPWRLLACLLAALSLAFGVGVASAATDDDTMRLDTRLGEARRLLDASRFAPAESAARLLLPEAERILGPSDPHTLDVLDVLVGALWRGGFAPAPETRALAERALAGRDTTRSAADSNAIACLGNAGQVRMQNADFDGAKPLIDRSIELRERWPGPDSLALAWALNDRATFAMQCGDFTAARADYRRVIRIREHGLPPNHPQLAWAYSNLAYLEQNAGDLIAARDLFRHALALFEAGGDAASNNIAHGLKNLAHVEEALGDTARARVLFERALAMRRRVNGPESAEVANSLNDLAALLRDSGHIAEARPLADQALAIRLRVYGPDHPETATSLLTVASLELASGDAIGARGDIERAVRIRERVFGATHANTARAEDRLVPALLACGRPDTACRVAEHALASKRAMLGDRHPDLAPTWLALAGARHAAGQDREAFDAALAAETIARDHLELVLDALPEAQALAYESARVTGLDLALALAVAAPGDRDRTRRVWDAVIRSRACVLDAMSMRLRDESPLLDPETLALRERERVARRRLARWIVNAPATRDSAWRAGLERARVACDAAGREVAAHDPVTRENRARFTSGLASVAGAMPPGSALVAYVRSTDPLAPGTRSARYLAFVRRADGGAVTLVPLGAARDMESATTRWRDAVARGTEPEARREGERLRRAMWDPLRPALGDAKLVLMVADGALVGVDPYALPDDAGGYLIERGPALLWLGAERDLITPPVAEGDERLIAFGGMSFPAASAGHDRFPALPQSRLEVRDVAAVWDSTLAQDPRRTPARVVCGAGATVDSFRVLAARASVLHVATHATRVVPASGGAAAGGLAGSGALAPMFAAGLVFTPSDARDPAPILSAAEAAMLDLRRTRWLVLSGCDTGSGPVAGREGVLGLRRAFAIAGARTQFVTVWGVRDDVCRMWMRALYHARFIEHRTTADAARMASLRMLARRRALGLSTAPAGWAGFVAVGDWR